MKYVLDPYILALKPDCDEATYLKYLQKVVKWRKMIDKHPKEVYMLSNTENILADLNCYPMDPAYSTDKSKGNNGLYSQLEDLNQTLGLIFGKTKCLDSESTEFWKDVTEIDINCDAVDNNSEISKEYKETFSSLLWFIYCHSKVVGTGTDAYVLFSKEVSSDLKVNLAYSEYVIADEEIKEVDYEDEFTVKSKKTHKEFLKDGEAPALIWKDANNRKDIDYGVRVMLYQAAGLNKLQESYDGYNFVVQESFYNDFNNNHYTSDDTILRRGVMTMAHVLMGANIHLEHKIRTGAGGANPQLVIDGHKAFRRNITTSVKVSYWKKSDEYRFSNILEHDFFEPTQEFETV